MGEHGTLDADFALEDLDFASLRSLMVSIKVPPDVAQSLETQGLNLGALCEAMMDGSLEAQLAGLPLRAAHAHRICRAIRLMVGGGAVEEGGGERPKDSSLDEPVLEGGGGADGDGAWQLDASPRSLSQAHGAARSGQVSPGGAADVGWEQGEGIDTMYDDDAWGDAPSVRLSESADEFAATMNDFSAFAVEPRSAAELSGGSQDAAGAHDAPQGAEDAADAKGRGVYWDYETKGPEATRCMEENLRLLHQARGGGQGKGGAPSALVQARAGGPSP